MPANNAADLDAVAPEAVVGQTISARLGGLFLMTRHAVF